MTALSPRAKSLVAKARQVAPLTVEHRTRIRTGLWSKLALPASLAVSGTATAMGLFSKVAVAALAVSVGFGGTLFVYEKVEQARNEEARAERQRMAVPKGPRAEPVASAVDVKPRPAPSMMPPLPVEAPVIAPIAKAARANVPKKEASPYLAPSKVEETPSISPSSRQHVAVTARGPSLEGELKLLNEAQRAATEHEAEKSLRVLEDYAAQFPNGVLREEAMVLNVIALCELERVDDAKTIARRLIELSPSAPVALRVKASCVGESNAR
ncbi:MAG: hypothetical protein K1X64_10965 [Myxococcaceae bacterium]|nr:hypothetical protein [Myxococcaceae bacterium]